MLLLLAACVHTPDPVQGAEVYAFACESCHGANGAAGVQVSGVPAADLGTVVPDRSDEALLTVITDGLGAMPRVNLDPNDADDCVAYVRATFGG